MKLFLAEALARSLGIDLDMVSVHSGQRRSRRLHTEITGFRRTEQSGSGFVVFEFSVRSETGDPGALIGTSANGTWFNDVIAEMSEDPRLPPNVDGLAAEFIDWAVEEETIVRSPYDQARG